MTVYLGVRQTVYLNTYDVIKEAFVKQGYSFSGRPQDLFYMRELTKNIGLYWSNFRFTFSHFPPSTTQHLRLKRSCLLPLNYLFVSIHFFIKQRNLLTITSFSFAFFNMWLPSLHRNSFLRGRAVEGAKEVHSHSA